MFAFKSDLFFFSSCGIRYSPHPNDNIKFIDPTTSPHAAELLNQIEAVNPLLHGFKGVGHIRISNGENDISLRLAFIGTSSQDMLRFSVLDMLGRPVETVSYNGKHIYLLSHTGDHKFITGKGNQKTLEKIIHIPISPSAIIQLLSGRVPIRDHDNSFIQKSGNDSNCIVLFSKKKIVEKIYMDKTNQVTSFIVFNRAGKRSYNVMLTEHQTFAACDIPRRLTISDGSGNNVSIHIDKYWVNPAYSPDIFKLSNRNK